MPYQTPIVSVVSGTVVGVGWYWGGGVVTVRGYVPYYHALEDTYYQHLTKIYAQLHEHISIGTLIGLSNTWIEFGTNPPWYGIWGPSPHPGKWINPVYSGYLASLVGGVFVQLSPHSFHPLLLHSYTLPLLFHSFLLNGSAHVKGHGFT